MAKARLGEVWCTFYGQREEIELHIFKECHFIKQMAFSSIRGCVFGNVVCNSVEELVSWCLNQGMENGGFKSHFGLFNVYYMDYAE